jgi:dephospho-CoA kinase
MIIGVTGSIGAGKETLTGFLREKGFVYFETSAMLKEMLAERKLELTRENMQNLGDELRKKDGVGALMNLLLERTEKGKNYIFDSLRNPMEADFLRNEVEDFVLIAVDAPREIRFKRIMQRGKPSDPKTWEDFLRIDERDLCDKENPLGQHVGKCIEIADFKIINDAGLEKSMKQVEEIYKKLIEPKTRE